MLRYGLYSRKSDKEDGDTIKSIEDQKAYWSEKAAHQGLLIAKVYEENKSAKTPRTRPVYQKMISDLKAGRIEAVLVWHVNRLARNMAEAGDLAQMLIDSEIKEIRTPNSTYTPADNILPLLLEQGSATQFSRDLSRTVTLSLEQMAKGGGWPHRAHIGYLNVRDPLNTRRGMVVPDPDRFPLIRRGMEMLLTGQHSMRGVIDAMNSWGLRTRQTDKIPSKPLCYSIAYALFRNPFYAGYVTYHGELYKGRHTPMLTAEEFQRLQEIVKKQSRSRRRLNSFTYTGMIRCGSCGRQVTAELKKKGGHCYTYYHCCDPLGRCSKRSISEIHLEQEIAGVLRAIRLDSEAAQAAQECIQRSYQGTVEKLQAAQKQRQARLAEIERERERLVSLLLKGVIADHALYTRKDEELLAEHNQLVIAVDRGVAESAQVEGQLNRVMTFACEAYKEFGIAEPDRKKAIALALGLEYTLQDRILSVQINPLLEKVVAFTNQKIPVIEPGNHGSGSHKNAHFQSEIQFGGPKPSLIEPDEDLLLLLHEVDFPDVFAN